MANNCKIQWEKRSFKKIIKIDKLLREKIKIIDVAEINNINNKELKSIS